MSEAALVRRVALQAEKNEAVKARIAYERCMRGQEFEIRTLKAEISALKDEIQQYKVRFRDPDALYTPFWRHPLSASWHYLPDPSADGIPSRGQMFRLLRGLGRFISATARRLP